MKNTYLIFAAAVTAALLLGCPSTTQNNIETEVTDNGTGGNNGGQGQGKDNNAPVTTARITAMPKVIYIEGETFDLTGIRVTVYSDGKAAADLTNDAMFRYNAPDMNALGTHDVVLSFTYSGETHNVTLTITIGEDQTHGYSVEILDETKTWYVVGEDTFSLYDIYYEIYDAAGNALTSADYSYYSLSKTVSEYPDLTKVGRQTVNVTFVFTPYAVNKEVTLTASYEIEIAERHGVTISSDVIANIAWTDLKDEIQRYKQDMTNRPYDYVPMDWSKAFPDNTTDWSKVKDVTIDLADVDTVDVIGATVLKRYIDAKLKKAGKTKEDIENIVHFTDYATDAKLNLNFNKLGEEGLSNTDFMGAIFDAKQFSFGEGTMYGQGQDIKWGKDGESDRTDDVIPGVELVSFPNQYEYAGQKDNSISQAFKFTSPAVVTMPQQDTTYDLTGTYKGGILGKVTIDGLENATMSGEIYKHDIKGIYDTFVKDNSSDASKLPGLTLNIISRVPDRYNGDTIVGGWNIYGTQLDKIVEVYYKHGNPDNRLQLESTDNAGFDATEYLNGGTMYAEQGNAYLDTAYQLDINTALVMAQAGTSFANVEIAGNPNVSVENPEFNTASANVRFSADMRDISFGTNAGSKGIIDIAGPAPQNLPSVGSSAVVIRPEAISDTPIDWNQMAYILDLSALSSEQAAKVYATGSYVRTAENISESDATIREIEQGTREGKSITAIEDEHNHASVSPKKMKEKKDANLMRAILNGKDKEYS